MYNSNLSLNNNNPSFKGMFQVWVKTSDKKAYAIFSKKISDIFEKAGSQTVISTSASTEKNIGLKPIWIKGINFESTVFRTFIPPNMDLYFFRELKKLGLNFLYANKGEKILLNLYNKEAETLKRFDLTEGKVENTIIYTLENYNLPLVNVFQKPNKQPPA